VEHVTPDQGGRSPSPQGSSPTQAYTTLQPREALISFKALTATTTTRSTKIKTHQRFRPIKQKSKKQQPH
jgi:hypothetical protein